MAERWYVVQSKPQDEALAYAGLIRRGFAVFFPRWLRQGARHVVEAPLFPSYLFAFFDPRASGGIVYSVMGVARVLGGENPWPVRGGAVEALMIKASSFGIVTLEDAEEVVQKYSAGQKVRVIDGAFSGEEGICISTKLRTIRLLLGLLGREVEVTVSQEQVRPAAPAEPGFQRVERRNAEAFSRYDKAVAGRRVG